MSTETTVGFLDYDGLQLYDEKIKEYIGASIYEHNIFIKSTSDTDQGEICFKIKSADSDAYSSVGDINFDLYTNAEVYLPATGWFNVSAYIVHYVYYNKDAETPNLQVSYNDNTETVLKTLDGEYTIVDNVIKIN